MPASLPLDHLEIDHSKGLIRRVLTGDWVALRPEEEVRQTFLLRLLKEWDYPPDCLHTETTIYKGSKKIGPADIVAYHTPERTQENIKLIVETKRPNRADGVEQLKTYLSPCKSAQFGIWSNGQDVRFLEVLDAAPYFREVLSLPRFHEKHVSLPSKSDLRPVSELITLFETCHNYIYANEGLLKEKAFDEVLKIIFMKMVDEKSAAQLSGFGITRTEEDELRDGKPSDFTKRMEALFDRVKSDYSDVFDPSEQLRLAPLTLAFIVGQLQNVSLINTRGDVKGIAFQTFVYAHQRGERGEFFTPHPVVDLAVGMLDPTDNDRVIDPACGSGGFLIAAMRHVWQKIDAQRADLDPAKRVELKLWYAHNNIRGIDINPDLAKVAKMHMILYDDGHTGIFAHNALDPWSLLTAATHKSIAPGHYDLVLTNPPFGTKGKVNSRPTLKQFDLGHVWRRKSADEASLWTKTSEILGAQVPDLLFLERCIQFLKPGGRMAIILPNGDLNNVNLQYVRDWLSSRARILASITLPQGTFSSAGSNPHPSLLALQALSPDQFKNLPPDYKVFLAVPEKLGFELRLKTAPPLYLRGPDGKPILNAEGEPILDSDVPDLISSFAAFRQREGIDF
jgi:type I restriction enzyme M protein